MQETSFLKQYTGIAAHDLLGSSPPLVKMARDGNGVLSFPIWNVPGKTAPTQDQVAAALAAPEPAPSPSELIAYANTKQNDVLDQVWTFNLGTASAPFILTTKLDDAGQSSYLKIYLWGLMNASVSGALEPYSNVDFSPLSLTPTQAMSFGQKAGAIVSQTYGALNSVVAGATTTPPTITTTAQIDAAAWPTSG